MDRSYWEKISPDYEKEIFDVLQNDRKGLIRGAIKKYSGTVIDIGCGVGKWLPFLSSSFKKVYAVDISGGNIATAKRNHSSLKNIQYQRLDVSSKNGRIPRFDLAVCINAILTSSLPKRKAFFRFVGTTVKKGGHLVLVLPSLESALLTRVVARQWQIDKAVFSSSLPVKEAAAQWTEIQQGNIRIDEMPTKHYLKEEIILLLKREGFSAITFKKIEYDWNTEFSKPPSWLKEVYPWDWLCLATRSLDAAG